MSNIARTLVNLDILSQDMQEELHQADPLQSVSEAYLDLLAQYKTKLIELSAQAQTLTEVEFTQSLRGSPLAHIVTSKQMLKVLISLTNYVLDYYNASLKAAEILQTDFAEQADKKLNILQSKAIKVRKQFKTVALALGQQDYIQFAQDTPLPYQQWCWENISHI